MKKSMGSEAFKWGVLSAIFAIAMPDLAMAQTSADVNALIHNVATNEMTALPFILSAVCYVGGAFMLISGALKLKAHAEKPDQNKLAPGVARLLAGGAITSVPAVTALVQKTTQISGGQASYSAFTVTFQ